MTLSEPERERFITENTDVAAPPLVPEVRLHLASDATALWELTEQRLERTGLPPPFWAFCWAGGQALSRYVLDHPQTVRGRRVLDFAAGGGVLSIASVLAGAAHVEATEIDPLALTAMRLNGRLNDVVFEPHARDVIGTDAGWDVVFAGDVCYERPMAERVIEWLRQLASRGAFVVMGDPGRTYMPKDRVTELARFSVPTPRTLEDRDVRETGVWRIEA